MTRCVSRYIQITNNKGDLNVKSTRDIIIGRTLRNIRVRGGLTQEDLADALHTTQTFVSRTESGLRPLKLPEAILYSVGLRITPSQLYDELWSAFERDKNSDDASDLDTNPPEASQKKRCRAS